MLKPPSHTHCVMRMPRIEGMSPEELARAVREYALDGKGEVSIDFDRANPVGRITSVHCDGEDVLVELDLESQLVSIEMPSLSIGRTDMKIQDVQLIDERPPARPYG